MIDKLRELTKNTPRLRKIMSFFFGLAFEPFISGYAAYMVKYLIFSYSKEKASLKQMGFTHIHLHLTKQWRRGDELDGAHRRYYKSQYGNHTVFIKVAFNDATIENEIYMSEFLETLLGNYIPSTIASSRCFQGDKKLLGIEFQDGLKPFYIPSSKELFERYCKEFLDILDVFCEHRIVHADVHPKNLMIDTNNDIHLLDFGISGIAGNQNLVDYNARPGTYYSEAGEYRIYDDAYSFVQMCNKLSMPDEYKNYYYRKIEEHIGRNVLKIREKKADVL